MKLVTYDYVAIVILVAFYIFNITELTIRCSKEWYSPKKIAPLARKIVFNRSAYALLLFSVYGYERFGQSRLEYLLVYIPVSIIMSILVSFISMVPAILFAFRIGDYFWHKQQN